MKKCAVLLFLLCLALCLQSSAQDASRPGYRETIQSLSGQVHEQLADLRRQSQDLMTSLAIAESGLELSQGRVKELQTELTDLNTCLVNTNRKLGEYSTKLTAYEVKLKQRARVIAGLLGVLLALLVIKVVAVFLYIKHIPVPRIIDILA